LKKSFPKILFALTIIVMLSVVSIGHTPDEVDYAIVTDAVSNPIPSGIVWSDNFDDEDISDWQQFIHNFIADPDTQEPGNSTAESGVLRHIDKDWSYAGHNSSVAFGTWSFDFDIHDPYDEYPDDEYHFYIVFISEHFDDDWLTHSEIGSAYAVVFYTYDDRITEFRLVRGYHDTGLRYMDDCVGNNIIGCRNIIITRELSGQFYVYLDGALKLKGKDLLHTTSERFYFIGHEGPAIDNVTVSNTIDYDAAPPEWDPPIPDIQIIAGDPFYYDLNATDYSGVDKWWISDTQNFTIDENGVITSNVELAVGEYISTVWVNDSLGNTGAATFSLIVNPQDIPTTPIPMELMVAVVGVGVVVILVLVIWRTRK